MFEDWKHKITDIGFKASKMSPFAWGLFQYYVEITGQKNIPIGIREEFLEGAISSGVGAVALYSLAKRTGSHLHLPEDEQRICEEFAFQAGALGGYAMMVFGGMVLHRIFDIPDVKWGM